MRILQPPGWPRPKGYSNGVVASGRQIYVAGMIGWNDREEFETNEFVGQFRRALQNVLAVLAEAGAGPEHVVRLTMYFVDKREYLADLRAVGTAYREVMGKNYPAMAAVEVGALMEDGARVEIEATAVVPEE